MIINTINGSNFGSNLYGLRLLGMQFFLAMKLAYVLELSLLIRLNSLQVIIL